MAQSNDPDSRFVRHSSDSLPISLTVSICGTTGLRVGMVPHNSHQPRVACRSSQLILIGMITYRKGSLLFRTPGESSSISSK